MVSRALRFPGAALLALTVLALAVAPSAHAHGLLKGAVPSDKARVKTAPKEIVITFSESLEPALSRIVVRDADGKQVDDGKSSVPSGNARILKVGVPALKPGIYTVDWAITSVDTHRTEGKYVFEVLK